MRWPSSGRASRSTCSSISLNDEALKNIRGAALVAHPPPGAGERSRRAGISTTLVCTVKRGVNDGEIGEIVRHALDMASACAASPSSRCRMPAATRASIPSRNRIVLSEIRRRIVEDSGVFADGDMIPLPCNPASISIGYGLRDGEKVIPLTSLVPREALLPRHARTPSSFEKYPELRRRFVDLLSLSTADTNTAERLGSLLCCLPDVPMPEGSGYENVFRVTIVEFLDRFNFCLGNVKRSCVHFVTPDGKIIPFDTYNTFYRPGAAGNARLVAEARDERSTAAPPQPPPPPLPVHPPPATEQGARAGSFAVSGIGRAAAHPAAACFAVTERQSFSADGGLAIAMRLCRPRILGGVFLLAGLAPAKALPSGRQHRFGRFRTEFWMPFDNSDHPGPGRGAGERAHQPAARAAVADRHQRGGPSAAPAAGRVGRPATSSMQFGLVPAAYTGAQAATCCRWWPRRSPTSSCTAAGCISAST